MPRQKQPLISVEYASKSYDDNPYDYDHLILRNVNLQIYEGEFVIIFGPSGSGKSSLLNLIAGLENPTAGRVRLRRRDLSHFNHKELAKYHRLKMGMVFQSFNLIKSLNVWENVALPQTANGVRYSLRRRRALRLLKLFGLEEYPDRHANELSGGEQQRVSIARALINNPFFLLVDEPTGNLDSKSAADVMKIFYGLNKHGKHTIIMVTHNPEQLQFASRVIYIQDGTVVKDERRGEVEHDIEPLKKEHLEELGSYKSKPEDVPVPPIVAKDAPHADH
jgi:ABC-type lipoprotein export system ATPase subunit